MAEESKGIPSWVLIVAALAIAYVLFSKVATGAAKVGGAAAGKGAVDEAFGKLGSAGSALGSFVGGLFGSSGSSSSHSSSSAFLPDQPDPGGATYAPGESFDEYTTGLFGPGINPDGTGA